MRNARATGHILAFGEIYSPNVGDGIIFDCLRHGMSERGINVLPADLSLRNGYSKSPVNAGPPEVGTARRFARYFVRRSPALRRLITMTAWARRERRQFIDTYAEAIRSCDGVVIGGGQILVDEQLFFPLRIQAIIEMARAAGKPVAVFSCGANARQGRIARHILHRMARQAVQINVRDRASAAVLLSLDGKLTVRVGPDIGFLAARTYGAGSADPNGILGINLMPHRIVAAFARDLKQVTPAEYLTFWKDLIGSALERGWCVRLMSNGDTEDHRTAHEVCSAFQSDRRVELAPQPLAPKELVDTLHGVDALITCRMHAGIVAYSLGKRVVPLVWDKKVDAVWSEADPTVRPLPLAAIFNGEASFSTILDRASPTAEATDNRKTITERLDRSLDELAACFALLRRPSATSYGGVQ